MVFKANDAGHRAVSSYLVFEALDEFLYITIGAALDDIPLRAIVYAQQAMVQEEFKEKPGREAEHVTRLRRPDCGTHGHYIFVDEYFAVIVVAQEVTEAKVVRMLIAADVVDECGCFMIESQDVGDHLVELRPE